MERVKCWNRRKRRLCRYKRDSDKWHEGLLQMKVAYMRDVRVTHGDGADLLDLQNPRIHFLSDSDNEDDTDRDVRPPPTKRRKPCISSNIPSILIIALPEARFSSER